MKKVSDKQREAIEEIYRRIEGHEHKLDSEVQVCNYEIESALESLQESVHEYNEIIDELNEAVSEVWDGITDFTDSKSQKWRGSDVGLAHAEWAECFENETEHAEDPLDQQIEVSVDLWHGKVDDHQWELKER
jgi:DNA repair exonuclease SbcCD ATPase subunit|tara:strand:- start:9773 stop:10171 length:399 start_codon:yes stop_codon:yes gene_type:complete